jgi:hypothetical protein
MISHAAAIAQAPGTAGTAIAGSLAALPVDNMPTLPILTEQVAQLLGQTLSFIMSTLTVSEPDNRPHLDKQFRAGLLRSTRGSLRDDCAGRDPRDSTMIEGGQLFNAESSDR